MAACPAGHDSAATDYCDTCGALMNGAPAVPGSEPEEPCPVCTRPRDERYCEDCGYDFVTRSGGNRIALPDWTGSTSAGVTTHGEVVTASVATAASGPWVAVVTADRAYFDTVEAEGLVFPPYCPERRVSLTGAQVMIGRRSVSRGITPEIDLTGPPEDPGVSHIHAVLLAQPDGTWCLVDPGSVNGTKLNDSLIEVNVPLPVGEGDRIHVGAWTAINLKKD